MKRDQAPIHQRQYYDPNKYLSQDSRIQTAMALWNSQESLLGTAYNRAWYIGNTQKALEDLRYTHNWAQWDRADLLSGAKQLAPALTETQREESHVTLRQSVARHRLANLLGIPQSFSVTETRLPDISGTLITYQIHREPPAGRFERMKRLIAGQTGSPVDGYLVTDDGQVVQFTGRVAKGRTVHGSKGQPDIIKPETVEVSSYTSLQDIEPIAESDLELTDENPANVIATEDWANTLQSRLAWQRLHDSPALSAIRSDQIGIGSYARDPVPSYTT